MSGFVRPRKRGRRLGHLVGTTRFFSSAAREEQFSLDILDLDARESVPTRIPLDFFGHGLAIHPKRPWTATLLEKRGPGGCALDLATRQVVRPISPMKGHAFYGHAAYSHEGDVLFVVETHLASKEGAVSIRDSSTFAVLATFPTYGIAPHDCHLVEQGRTLVVTNGGGPVDSPFLPSVTFIDVNTRALLEKHEMRDPRLNSGHVAVGENREFALVSAPRDGLPARTSLGGVSLRKRGQRWGDISVPELIGRRLIGESLSVAIHGPSRTVVATHPDGNLITFWSLDEGRLTGTLDLPGPRGVAVTLDEQFYVVSYGAEARLLLIEARSFRVLSNSQLGEGMFGGAHVYTWTR